MTVADLVFAVDSIAPFSVAFEWDRVGLQLGRPDDPAGRVLVTLDPSSGAISRAIEGGFQAIVGHHPVIWDPLKSVGDGPVYELVQAGVAYIAAHTNWDCAPDGLNDALAIALGLSDVQPLAIPGDAKRLKLVTFVPRADADSVIDALSQAGAGRIGLYSRCAFLSDGAGTFVGGVGTSPTVRSAGNKEEVAEARLEMVLDRASLVGVAAALSEAHPYEEPAYDIYSLEPQPIECGRVGELESPVDAAAFAHYLEERLGERPSVWSGGRDVTRVAVVGGGASGYWKQALSRADAFVTGEVKQSDALAAQSAGLTIAAAGHYATEQPGMAHLCERLRASCPGVSFELYEPAAGADGRPR